MRTILIAGLGNPGKKYEKTRHNAGFMFVDYFWENYRDELGLDDWQDCKKLKSKTSYGKLGSRRIILLKPQTFMNLSGKAVAAAVKYYKLKLEDIIVIHDEIDLPLGKYRLSVNASSAGHQGVQNIIDALGTKDFARLRIGIENRGEKKIETEKYVLGKLNKQERITLEKVLKDLSRELLEKTLNFKA
ncbi:MAG: aminoacyl-tRNA hydrolase [Parcubacteria group bacterium]|jgi:PTH1 family peptidyl-tRNA hydrolase